MEVFGTLVEAVGCFVEAGDGWWRRGRGQWRQGRGRWRQGEDGGGAVVASGGELEAVYVVQCVIEAGGECPVELLG